MSLGGTVKVASSRGPVRAVVRYAEARVPTAYGEVRLLVYREGRPGESPREHVAMVFGELSESPEVLVRVHSECLTSEVFRSLKCDCREQLERAIARVQQEGTGVVLYLRQEGRGIGLGNKIRAYALQQQGYDTIEANHQLGFETDLRSYDIAAHMLKDLGVRAVALMTNNPDKISGLSEAGIEVVRRIPLEIAPNDHSEGYLQTKRQEMGHLLELVAS